MERASKFLAEYISSYDKCIKTKCSVLDKLAIKPRLILAMQEAERHWTYYKQMHKLYHNMALASWQLENITDALKYAKKSAKYHPNYMNIYKMSAYLNKMTGKSDAAHSCDVVFESIKAVNLPAKEKCSACLDSNA